MIILDSNQLRQAAPPDGAVLGLLRKLAEPKGHALAIPEMVKIEHLAHLEHDAQIAISFMAKTVKELSKIFNEDLTSKIPPLFADQAVKGRSKVLEEVFTILPTPEGAEGEALIREARRQRPTNAAWDKDKGGSGARDAVIWLTVKEAAQKSDEEILFLSQDNDFGNADGWHPELARELVGPNCRLLHGGIDELLAEIAEKADEPTDLMKILQCPVVVEAVTARYSGEDVFFQMLAHVTTGEPNSFIGSSAPQMTPLEKAGRVHSYSVGDLTWIAVRVKWSAIKSYDVIPVAGPMSSQMRPLAITVSPHGVQWWAEVKFDVVNTLLVAVDGDGEPVSAEVTNDGVLEFRDYQGVSV